MAGGGSLATPVRHGRWREHSSAKGVASGMVIRGRAHPCGGSVRRRQFRSGVAALDGGGGSPASSRGGVGVLLHGESVADGGRWRRSLTPGTDERDAGEAVFVGGKLVGGQLVRVRKIKGGRRQRISHWRYEEKGGGGVRYSAWCSR
jgi:hypothetical protein